MLNSTRLGWIGIGLVALAMALGIAAIANASEKNVHQDLYTLQDMKCETTLENFGKYVKDEITKDKSKLPGLISLDVKTKLEKCISGKVIIGLLDITIKTMSDDPEPVCYVLNMVQRVQIEIKINKVDGKDKEQAEWSVLDTVSQNAKECQE